MKVVFRSVCYNCMSRIVATLKKRKDKGLIALFNNQVIVQINSFLYEFELRNTFAISCN